MLNIEIFEKIKLIIWDLDDTFWTGIISEGEIKPNQDNINFIHDTIDMGIMNSICSKNELLEVKKKLCELNVWDCFVFPSIDWSSKGARIKNIIELMNLRAVNVLFLDDNIQNLEEAKFFCPGIVTAQIQDIKELYSYAKEAKHNDIKHTRLQQYRLLEEKVRARSKYSSNEDFLFFCNIKVERKYDCISNIDRIHELIVRSNQLNFTKVRASIDELISLFKNPTVECGYVTVSDRFGEYGIIGFYAIQNGCALHFVFSCRTLGMHVEQYIYKILGCPKLNIVGDVAVALNNNYLPPWINCEKKTNSSEKNILKNNLSILIKGPCDMLQMYSFFNSCSNLFTEFSYTNEKGVLIEGHNHTSQIVTSLYASEQEKEEILSEIPFFDKDMLSTLLTSKQFDVLVLSMLTDGNLGIYKHKKSGWEIAYGEKFYDLTNPNNASKYINHEVATMGVNFSQELINDFLDKFEYVDNLDFTKTINNIDKIYRYIGDKTKLILLLGSEQEFNKKSFDSYINRHIEHKKLNNAIRQWASDKKNVKLICYDKYIKNQSDFLDTINHFVKRVYYELATDLIKEFNIDDLSIKGKGFLLCSSLMQKLRTLKSKLLKHK